MYRIEVAPGEETVFRTIEELAVGIRNGLVTPRARIYHNVSQKWLPIGLHPHYKKAMELPAVSAAHPPTPAPTPVPGIPRSRPRLEPTPAAKVPAPSVSAVVAMQQEVLRDLPVVVIPEPLRWSAPSHREPPEPATPPGPVMPLSQAVQATPTATVTYAPRSPILSPPAPASPPATREPVEEMHPRPTARRSHRPGGRPLLLLGVAAGLVLAAHFGLTPTPPAPDTADTAAPEEVVTEPAESDEPAEEPVARATPKAAETATPAKVTSSPARVRMTPGPAFTGSVPAQPGTDTAGPRAKGPAVPVTTPAAPAPSLAPAPVELELGLPNIKSDSIAPARSGDTLAMKKILRALNGSKP
jgi:hypothetical protein